MITSDNLRVTTREAGAAALREANAAISMAVLIIRAHQPVIEQFLEEAVRADSVMPIVNPTLYMSRERRGVSDLMTPVYKAAAELLVAHAEAAEKMPKGGPDHG